MVRSLVHLDLHLHHFGELLHVGDHAARCQNALVGQWVGALVVAVHNRVTLGDSSISGDHTEVSTSDGDGGTVVVGVWIPLCPLDGSSGSVLLRDLIMQQVDRVLDHPLAVALFEIRFFEDVDLGVVMQSH